MEETKLEEQKIVDDRHLLQMQLKHEVDKIKVNIIFIIGSTYMPLIWSGDKAVRYVIVQLTPD